MFGVKEGVVNSRSLANAAGVRPARPLCGRAVSESTHHAAIACCASGRLTNEFSFTHSSRIVPLKLSIWAFCTGLPGSMNAICT